MVALRRRGLGSLARIPQPTTWDIDVSILRSTWPSIFGLIPRSFEVFAAEKGQLRRITSSDMPENLDRNAIIRCVVLGPERTLNRDVAYGIRMIVDIALGSVSSGPFADPTTTVQAIDRLHDILRHIVRRPLHSGQYKDEDGVLRLSVPALTWEGFVQLSFDEIRRTGAASPQISRRLSSALEDLLSLAPQERRPALEHQRKLLQESVRGSVDHSDDQRRALTPDPSGLGSSPDLSHTPSHEQP